MSDVTGPISSLPGSEHTPAAVSPHRNTANLDPKKLAQSILDNAGRRAPTAEFDAEPDYDPEPGEVVRDDADAEFEAVAAEAPAPRAARGRARKDA